MRRGELEAVVGAAAVGGAAARSWLGVPVRLHGACVGCPSSTMTLQVGIERNLKAHVPEVKGVEAVD